MNRIDLTLTRCHDKKCSHHPIFKPFFHCHFKLVNKNTTKKLIVGCVMFDDEDCGNGIKIYEDK
ncbi:hypothetical protein UFOVP733_7 [uncultured Caudovirales phage]|uniref:Uncharacterized protein n=1 Tax=uncultured Caudovirales phage TaxID=2100421 RepID=A0A6J7X3B5_9CAUD|nr:hypothetical protein UFOVP733_7 [uncultured Caudovirales phage]CAB5224965.1 hypothetical protein UFOVP743_52 [uncultured Caudovirales phage]